MVINVVRTFKDADERIRYEWGQALTEQMETYRNADGSRGITRKALQQTLRDETEVDVTVRAIGQWCAGETAPKPSTQAALAHVFGVPVHRLFPITYRAAA